jgi:hypothetical protein
MWAQLASMAIQIGTNYLLSRINAPDGPRLKDRNPQSGEYGIPIPLMFGEKVRAPGLPIAQDKFEEHKHKVKDHSALAGAATGAITGAMYGGPVGAVVGAAAGFLLGSATPDQYYYTYSVNQAHLLCRRIGQDPIEGLSKIVANGKTIFKESSAVVEDEEFDVDGRLIWRSYKKNKYFKGLTLYAGHTDQPLDPLLEDKLDETGAYPFSVYVVFEDLDLTPWGNSLPNLEYIVKAKTGESLAGVAEFVCQVAGINPNTSISSTALAADVVGGYLVNQETTCWDALKPLLPVYGVDAAEVSGQIRFYRRSQSMRATIPLADMGAYSYGDSPPEKLFFKRTPDINLPQETTLTFVDPERDYQTNSMGSRRTEGDARSNVSVDLPLVLTANQGATAAALMHWDAWLGRTAVNFTLTDAWVSLEPGFAYGIPFGDKTLAYRITRKTRGVNGIIEVEAISDESVTYTASEVGSSGTMPPEESTEFADTRVLALDMPIISDAHDDYGFYVVMAGTDEGWTRGKIQMSGDGVTYGLLIDDPGSAVIGDVVGTLAAGSTSGLDDTLDTTTVLTVTVLHEGMTFESATDAELDAWDNFCFVGKDGLGEYLQFKTATQTGPTTWELTDLRRGRRGTDHAIGTHTSGEEFALLGEEGVFRVVYTDTDKWGDTLNIRGVTFGQDEADADILAFVNTGEGKSPFSPIEVEGSWDGSNNLTATFDSRSRLFAGGLGIDDNFEFEIEITNATPVRTITVTAETFNYSAADQTADGLTPGTVVEGRIRQTSDVNDGRWREFALYGPAALLMDSTLVSFDSTLVTMDAG